MHKVIILIQVVNIIKSETNFDMTSEDTYDLNIPFAKLISLGDISSIC